MPNIFYELGIGALDNDAIAKLKHANAERTKQGIIINWGYEILKITPFNEQRMKRYVKEKLNENDIVLQDGLEFFERWTYS